MEQEGQKEGEFNMEVDNEGTKKANKGKKKQIPMQVWQMGKAQMNTKERMEILTISTMAAKREKRAMIKKEEEEGGYREEDDKAFTEIS